MWDNNRPVYDKLPTANWKDNKLADYLTAYWDDLLVDLKNHLDNPTHWLHPEQSKPEYLDYVGMVLCGYGKIWLPGFSESVKRRLIRQHIPILQFRGSRQSIELLIQCIIPGSKLIHFPIPLADIAQADISQASEIPHTNYIVALPTHITRNGSEWKWVEHVVKVGMPLGNVRVQYAINLPGLTIAGDRSV